MTTLVDFLVEPAQRKNNFMLLSAWKNLKKKKLAARLMKRNEMMNNICRIEDIKTINSQTSVCDKLKEE